nr:unnamed protein product [Haemonchus contortus]
MVLKRAVGLAISADGVPERDKPPQFVQKALAVILPLPQHLEEVVIPEIAPEAVPSADPVLQDRPQPLNTLSVDSGGWIHKIDTMADRLVDVTEIGKVIVTTPHIGPDGSPRSDVLLDDLFQGG